jgi:FAD/FMN-containing dehydrogenase
MTCSRLSLHPILKSRVDGMLAQRGLLAKPRTTEQVATLVAAAHAAGVAVIPYGGGTGLVGGQIAEDGVPPLILSLERMTALRSMHAEEGVMVVEAGMILADVPVTRPRRRSDVSAFACQ